MPGSKTPAIDPQKNINGVKQLTHVMGGCGAF